MEHVYVVTNEWATEDANGVSVKVFKKHDDAYEEMQKQIQAEINENMAQAFFNGEPIDGYCVDEGIDFWECWEDGYYTANHVLISIRRHEVL